MSYAAKLEDSVNKHPVTPGAVLPKREIFADMLMMTKDYAKALENYKTSLKISPNRFNSLNGARRAAEKRGNKMQATKYYSKIIQLTENAEVNRPISD